GSGGGAEVRGVPTRRDVSAMDIGLRVRRGGRWRIREGGGGRGTGCCPVRENLIRAATIRPSPARNTRRPLATLVALPTGTGAGIAAYRTITPRRTPPRNTSGGGNRTRAPASGRSIMRSLDFDQFDRFVARPFDQDRACV